MFKIKNVICQNCGQENLNTNIKCTKCGHEINSVNNYGKLLTNEEDKEKAKKVINVFSNLIPIVSSLPFIFFGIMAAIIVTFMNKDNNRAPDNYLTTTAYFEKIGSCNLDDSTEVCNAIYSYTVNGVTYEKSPSIRTNKKYFPKETVVKYDPNEPSDSVVQYSSWSQYYVTYVSIIAGIIIFIIDYFKISKKISKVVDEQISKLN